MSRAVRSKPGICLGDSEEEAVEGAVWATERTAANISGRAKKVRIRIFASQRNVAPLQTRKHLRSVVPQIGPQASLEIGDYKDSTRNTTTPAVRLGNSRQVSGNKLAVGGLRRFSYGWSGISWDLCVWPRSAPAFPPAVGQHCCKGKDPSRTCPRYLHPYRGDRRCYSGA